MNLRRWMGPALLLVGLVYASTVSNGQQIEWKAFKGKDKFYQVVATETVQDLKVADMNFKQKQTQKFLMEWTPKGTDKDKITIEQKIIGVEMDLDIGGNKITYKSYEDNTAKNPMTQFFKALTDKGKFTLTVDAKTHKVEKVEGLKELVDELTKVNKSFEPVLKQILSDKTVETLAEPVFGMVPADGKIPESKKWDGPKTTLSMGPLGTYTTQNKYTSEGEDKDNKNLVKIKVETDLTYEKPSKEAADKGGLPFKIEEGKLTTSKSNGTILFNKDKGRIESSKLHVELKGNLEVNISNTKTNVELNQTQDVTVTTVDEIPAPWKKK